MLTMCRDSGQPANGGHKRKAVLGPFLLCHCCASMPPKEAECGFQDPIMGQIMGDRAGDQWTEHSGFPKH